MKVIPTVTQIIGGNPIRTRKVPMYKLKSQAEEAAHQQKLGKMAQYYYGTRCESCCGVKPKFFTDQDFAARGYYVCLVCGKESEHCDMHWQAKEAWNEHRYVYVPDNYQYSMFDKVM